MYSKIKHDQIVKILNGKVVLRKGYRYGSPVEPPTYGIKAQQITDELGVHVGILETFDKTSLSRLTFHPG